MTRVPWPHGDPRDVVRAVLAQPAYRTAAARAGAKTWQDELREALHRAWDWLMQPFRHLSGGETLATIVGAVVVIALVAVLGMLLVRVVRERRRMGGGSRSRARAIALAGDRDARALLDDALAAAAAGRHREAAVLLWASALHALDERGRVRFDASRSPGEWRRAVRDPAFDGLARDAVVALFGDCDPDAALVGRMRSAYDRVVGA